MAFHGNINTVIMNIINAIQYPIFDLIFRNTIPVYGLFQRFCFYTKRDNIGDDLNIDFFELVTKRRVVKAEFSPLVRFYKKKPYSLIGSILERTITRSKGSIVWGSGFKYYHEQLNSKYLKNHTFLAVRGPMTRDILIKNKCSCPEVYGDPIILISKFYPINNVNKKYKYGIIPHHLDRNLPVVKNLEDFPNCTVIDVKKYSRWQDVIQTIVSCDVILSSSLHGIIIADSYNVPNLWVRFSDYIDGGGFKFRDYFSGVGKSVDCYDLSTGLNTTLIDSEIKKWEVPKIHEEFEKSCPLF